MTGNDRTIHARLLDGSLIVRYDRAGKWRIEKLGDSGYQVTVGEAAELVASKGAAFYVGQPGGSRFDLLVRQLVRQSAGEI